MTTIAAQLDERQIKLLLMLSAPAMVALTATDVTRSLERLGLIAVTDTASCLSGARAGYRITPAGLRASADALKAGLYDRFIDTVKKKA